MIPARGLKRASQASCSDGLCCSHPKLGDGWRIMAGSTDPKENSTHCGCHLTAPRPLARRIEALKHPPLPTLPARPVRVEHARRAGLSQTAVLASARYLAASMHHPKKRVNWCECQTDVASSSSAAVQGGTTRLYRHLYQSRYKDRYGSHRGE
jgi:hypothetical protein